jgi:hypothetical protein
MYTITLADGTKLENLELNGNNFVSKTAIDESIFTSKNLKKVTIVDEDGATYVFEYQVLEHFAQYDDGYYFILRDKSPDEDFREDINAKIDYLAMMMEVEL